jgi:hypothetical protein
MVFSTFKAGGTRLKFKTRSVSNYCSNLSLGHPVCKSMDHVYLRKKGIQNGTESMDASSYVYLKKLNLIRIEAIGKAKKLVIVFLVFFHLLSNATSVETIDHMHEKDLD